MRYSFGLSDGSVVTINTLLKICVREVLEHPDDPEFGGQISVYPLGDVGNYIDLKQLPSEILTYLMARKLK